MTGSPDRGTPSDASTAGGEVVARARVTLRDLDREGRLVDVRDELDAAMAETAPPAALGSFELVLERARRRLLIDPHVPVDAAHRGAVALKRLGRKSGFWYVSFVTDQVSELAAVVVDALDRLDRRTRALEARSTGATRIREVVDAGLPPLPDSLGPALASIVGDLQPVVVTSVTGEPPVTGLGRVVDCADGSLALDDASAAAVVVARGLAGSDVDAQVGLVVDAARVVSSGGVLVVVLADVELAPGSIARELAGGPQLPGATWVEVLRATGLDDVEVHDVVPGVQLVTGRRP